MKYDYASLQKVLVDAGVPVEELSRLRRAAQEGHRQVVRTRLTTDRRQGGWQAG